MEAQMKICDPIHGFIRLNCLEKKLIDSKPFQRLRYIRQMGVDYLVYPGATHTRFEHSLGVMEVADKIYTKLRPNSAPYWKQILRLAALCHDMGHLPFSHTAEKRLLPTGGHEQMTRKLIESDELQAIWKEIGPHACEDIIRLSIEDHGLEVSDEELFLAKIITEDNFGADRIEFFLNPQHQFSKFALLRMIGIKSDA